MIEIKNLSKKYKIVQTERYLTIRDTLSGLIKKPFSMIRNKSLSGSKVDFWALKDISLNIKKGEVVGLIGRNGAGKTTLLKILSRVTCPSRGQARLLGRVGSLLEVGTGFHSELTGRENIYFNGSILGMKKREIDKKFNEIVEFSGVGDFLDTPVKRFSSGMLVRLAFSVAAHLEPEILLIDEVLAVGDTQFQKKCMGKMKEGSGSGRTIIFVSHNMAAIRSLCERAILLDQGRVLMDEDSHKVTAYYLDQKSHQGARVTELELINKIEVASAKDKKTISLKEISLLGQDGQLRNRFNSDEPIMISITYECLYEVRDLRITAQIVDEENRPILTTQNIDDDNELKLYQRAPGRYNSNFTLPANIFGENHLYISLHMEHPTVGHLLVNKILDFEVTFGGYTDVQYGKFSRAYMRPRLKWNTQTIREEMEKKSC